MPREKSQRPEVFATGTREKLWKVRYREYYLGTDGKEHSRAKAATWSRKDHTKAQAQDKADTLISALRHEVPKPKPDGGLTLQTFWDAVYLPIRKRKWSGHTPKNVEGVWARHIQPSMGSLLLREIKKAHIEIRLGEMADAGLGEVMLRSVLDRLHSVLEEALDNDYIDKNPCRKVDLPPCAPSKETRSLTEEEVAQLWDQSIGREYVMWRLCIMTGARPGEVTPLTRADITAEGLLIDETLLQVKGEVTKLPKGNKARVAVLTDSLRAELAEWLSTHSSDLLFPNRQGGIYRHNSKDLQRMLARARTIIPDMQFRMCRTTFATLFEGDEADRTSIMGHTDPAFTLARYRKPIMQRRQRSVEELESRLRNVVPIRPAV